MNNDDMELDTIDDLELVALIDDRSPLRDLGGEIRDSIEDSGYSSEEQVLALVEAIKQIADGEDYLLDVAALALSK